MSGSAVIGPAKMSSRASVGVRITWWICIVVAVGGMVVAAPYASTLQNPWFVIPQVVYLAVGAVLSWRRPNNAVGWVLLTVAVLNGILVAGNMLAELAFDHHSPGEPIPWWGQLGAWVANWIWPAIFYAMTALMYLLYPDGLPSPRWRPFLWGSAAVTGAMCLVGALSPTVIIGDSSGGPHSMTVANPLSPWQGADLSAQVDPLDTITTVLSLGIAVVAIASLFVRRRHADQVARLQLRWFAFAAVIFLAMLCLQLVVPGGNAGAFSNVSFSLALACIPLACGIAIMRYRLYDIDRVVSRTASYAIVTAVLVLTYVVIVTSVSRLVRSQSSLVVAAATLAAAALFRPLLSRVQRIVDRRFNREAVDGQRAVEEFGRRLADQVAPDRMLSELVAVSRLTLAPQTVSVWIRRE